MKELVPRILKELESAGSAALATVLARKGSAPRGAGACMLVCRDGRALGTVGGGALEHAATALAVKCAAEGRSALMRHRLSDAGELGMVCGGEVTLHLWYIDGEYAPLFEELKRSIDGGRDAWLERVLAPDGSVISARLLTESPLELAAVTSETPLTFVEPITAQNGAFIFGGGHIAAELAPLLGRLDYSVTVFDDREEFANAARFPDAARVIVGDFRDIGVSVSRRDSIVIMTRGHSYDNVLLAQALKTDAAYIGLIGSRSKVAATKSAMLAQGFTARDFQRVHTPIGLPILAETPAEIAVSIAAEIILLRRKRLKALSDNDG